MTGGRATRWLALALVVAATPGCFALAPSAGGGAASFSPPRLVRAADVAVPEGYAIAPVAVGLTFPTGVAFDEAGRIYVSESGYAYGETWTTPRVLRIEPDGRAVVVAEGGRNGPWNGLAFHDGALFVAEGGQLEGGRILRIELDGRSRPLVEGLPSQGDHHTNGPVVGADGWLYFGQGSVTNAGVVGEDNAEFGWLRRFPRLHDVPCADVRLNGVSARTANPLTGAGRGAAVTGAFAAFGEAAPAGTVVPGALPCSGAIMRVHPRSGALELVAWGFRNPFGLAFGPDGRLWVTDNSYDDRGSRPVHGAGDLLWAVQRGAWHGWPDFHGARRLDAGDHYLAPGKARPEPVLASRPNDPPPPAAVLGVHAAAAGLDLARGGFGSPADAFVAEFGDQAPGVGKVAGPVGFKVVRVDLATGVVNDFAVNRGRVNGPASRLRTGGLERPIAARFDPAATALYVVDFGVLTTSRGVVAHPSTGVLWRITRSGVRTASRRDGGVVQ